MNLHIDMEQVNSVIFKTDFYMKLWDQREFRRDYVVRSHVKKSIRGLCEQFRENWQCGKQSFP